MASSSQCSEECNRLVLEAINESGESSVSKFRLVIYSYSESEILASLITQCDENGENPLVVAIKGENAVLIDAFVEFLQTSQYFIDIDHPLLLNAFDKLSHQISIVKLIDLLVNQLYPFCGIEWLEFLAQVFIESTSFTRQEKVIALELIGAMLIINLPSMEQRYTVIYQAGSGLHCWREAMTLRYLPPDGEPLLPKIPDVSVPSVASSVVFGSAVEVMSMEELDLLEENFERDITSDRDAVRLTCKKSMQRQALLVVRRLTSQSNNEHPYRLYLQSLLNFGTHCENETNRSNSAFVINTYLLILEQMAGFDPKLLPRKLFDFFLCTLHNLSLNFISMLRQPLDSEGNQELSYTHLLAPTKFFGTIAEFFPDSAMISSIDVDCTSIFGDLNYHRDFDGSFNFAELVFNFVAVLKLISPRLSSQEKKKLEEYYSNYILTLFRERTTTVLHVAVQETIIGVKLRFRAFRTVEHVKSMINVILKLGADPNAIDEYGRTPIHLLAENERFRLDENVSLFQALVEAGTHLDIAADNGETVISFLKAVSKSSHQYQDPFFESLINKVFPLSCYCAPVIRRHGIPFDRLPLHLQEFVSRHSAKSPNDPTED